MSTKKHLISVRSNTSFSLNYDKLELEPSVELILLLQEPRYALVKKNTEIDKTWHVTEFRANLSLPAVNELIGKLQAVAAGLQQFDQMAVALNQVIAQARVAPKEDGK